MTAVAINLVKLRKSKKLTQMQLAKLTGFTRATIARYESGEGGVDAKTIAAFAHALDVEETELTSGPKLTSEDYKAFYELALECDKVKKQRDHFEKAYLGLISLIPTDIFQEISKLTPENQKEILIGLRNLIQNVGADNNDNNKKKVSGL